MGSTAGYRRLGRRLANLPLLYLRYHLWRVHPRRLARRASKQTIDRPIFLLGVQGGGLTLVSRMLRRHPDVVSVTGNCTYWAGPDEMQNVMGTYLPQSLTGALYKKPKHAKYPAQQYRSRSWLYATDELLPLYRRTDADANAGSARRLRQAIQIALSIYGHDGGAVRFVDKSQSFTVRLSFVNRLLDGTEPRFLIITRNPYAICYRAAVVKTPLSRLAVPVEERLRLASQHWANSFECALEDAPRVQHFKVMRFEDILADPAASLQEICEFTELAFDRSMLPAAEHRIPIGSTGSSKGDHKWYPIRPDVNDGYVTALQPWMSEIIHARVGELADRWGYTTVGP